MPASKHHPNAFELEVRGRKLAVKVDPRQRERMLGENKWEDNRWRGQYAGCFGIGRTPEDVLREFQDVLVEQIQSIIKHNYLDVPIYVGIIDENQIVGWPDFTRRPYVLGYEVEVFSPTDRWSAFRVVGLPLAPWTHELALTLSINKKSWGYLAVVNTMYPGKHLGYLEGDLTEQGLTFIPRNTRGQLPLAVALAAE